VKEVKMMIVAKVVNLTPHEVNINGVTFPPSGTVARVATVQTDVEALVFGEHTFPVVHNTYGEVQGLPDPEPGTVYLVSTLVLAALEAQGIYRDDVFAPDTSPQGAIRGPDGQIKGVKRLVGMKKPTTRSATRAGPPKKRGASPMK
jgi:hypothetical protein